MRITIIVEQNGKVLGRRTAESWEIAEQNFGSLQRHMTKIVEPEMCECGHDEGMHVDCDAQCFDITCGCKEFMPVDEKLKEIENDSL